MSAGDPCTWKSLNHLQVGRYAEHLVKMELIRAGMNVFSCEVDDRGIDLVVRLDDRHYVDVQVKSLRRDRSSYIFMPKNTFDLRENLILALVPFIEGQWPRVYLVPAIRWRQTDGLFKSRDYEGGRSKPEWGMDLTARRLVDLPTSRGHERSIGWGLFQRFGYGHSPHPRLDSAAQIRRHHEPRCHVRRHAD